MKTPAPKRIPPVRVGDTTVRIYRRTPNLFTVKWREAGRARATSITGTLKEAESAAREKAKLLNSRAGGAVVSGEELELLKRLKEVAGNRSAFVLLDEVEKALKDLRGHSLSQAVNFYRERGPMLVESITVGEAIQKFLDGYKKGETLKGLRKELKPFADAYGEMALIDLSQDLLTGWIGRVREDGSPPAPRYFNNRLGTWTTFLRRCQKKKYLRAGPDHPASHLEKEVIGDKTPTILTLDQMRKLLAKLPKELLAYVAVGGFAGIRPFEMLKVKWEDFDWRTNTLHVTLEAGGKTGERFVPLQPNLVRILLPLKKDSGKFCMTHSREMVSKIARSAEILSEWEQDILRHSFCSYRLAQTSDINLVAEEAGNSPQIIRRHYKKPMLKADGAEWFTIGLEGAQ